MARKSQSLKERMAGRIARAKADVFTPADFSDLGGYDQVLRGLRQLVAEGVLCRLGYGVYGRLMVSRIDGSRILTTGFGGAIRQALRKLDVPFEESQTVKDYNAGKTTQIPSNTVLVLRKRFSRKLSFRGMEPWLTLKKAG